MGLTINNRIYNYNSLMMGGYMSTMPMPSFFGYGFGCCSPFGFNSGFYNPYTATTALVGSVIGFNIGAGIASLLNKHKS